MLNYNGFNTKVITISKAKNDDNLLGKAVKLDAHGALVACEKNDDFIGICVGDRGDYASVQAEGYIQCEYTGTISSYGWSKLVCGDGGKVAASSTASSPVRRIMTIDATNKTVGFIL